MLIRRQKIKDKKNTTTNSERERAKARNEKEKSLLMSHGIRGRGKKRRIKLFLVSSARDIGSSLLYSDLERNVSVHGAKLVLGEHVIQCEEEEVRSEWPFWIERSLTKQNHFVK